MLVASSPYHCNALFKGLTSLEIEGSAFCSSLLQLWLSGNLSAVLGELQRALVDVRQEFKALSRIQVRAPIFLKFGGPSSASHAGEWAQPLATCLVWSDCIRPSLPGWASGNLPGWCSSRGGSVVPAASAPRPAQRDAALPCSSPSSALGTLSRAPRGASRGRRLTGQTRKGLEPCGRGDERASLSDCC